MSMLGRLVDVSRAVVATSMLTGAGYLSAVAPDPNIPVGGGMPLQEPLFEWAVRQGGAFAIIAIVLFFYRRDYKYLTEFWKEQHKITSDLAVQCAKANADMASALRENTIVVHQAKNVLREYAPAQRAIRLADEEARIERRRGGE